MGSYETSYSVQFNASSQFQEPLSYRALNKGVTTAVCNFGLTLADATERIGAIYQITPHNTDLWEEQFRRGLLTYDPQEPNVAIEMQRIGEVIPPVESLTDFSTGLIVAARDAHRITSVETQDGFWQRMPFTVGKKQAHARADLPVISSLTQLTRMSGEELESRLPIIVPHIKKQNELTTEANLLRGKFTDLYTEYQATAENGATKQLMRISEHLDSLSPYRHTPHEYDMIVREIDAYSIAPAAIRGIKDELLALIEESQELRSRMDLNAKLKGSAYQQLYDIARLTLIPLMGAHSIHECLSALNHAQKHIDHTITHDAVLEAQSQLELLTAMTQAFAERRSFNNPRLTEKK